LASLGGKRDAKASVWSVKRSIGGPAEEFGHRGRLGGQRLRVHKGGPDGASKYPVSLEKRANER